MIILFALSIVHLAGAATRFAGWVTMLGSRVLPHVFGYLAFVLGDVFGIAGVIGLFSPIQNVVNYLSFIQGIWFLARVGIERPVNRFSPMKPCKFIERRQKR